MQAALIFHTLTGKGVWLWSVLDCARNNYPRPGVSASSDGLHCTSASNSRRHVDGSVMSPRFVTRKRRGMKLSSISLKGKREWLRPYDYICPLSRLGVLRSIEKYPHIAWTDEDLLPELEIEVLRAGTRELRLYLVVIFAF